MRRQRVLRRLLVKYRASGKIDKHLYHELYHAAKGNTFKHKRALVEHVCSESSEHLSKTRYADILQYRSTRPRPRRRVRDRSRRRWTPSVLAPRPLASARPRDSRPSGTLCSARRSPSRFHQQERCEWTQWITWRPCIRSNMVGFSFLWSKIFSLSPQHISVPCLLHVDLT